MDLDKLAVNLSMLVDKIPDTVNEAVEKTAQSIWEDVIINAPFKTGAYIDSIQVFPLEKTSDSVSCTVGTNYTVITTGKNPGIEYNLGNILENGTSQHAIPGAFYGYKVYPEFGDWPDFHPGTVAQPHFTPALLKNEEVFKANLKQAIKEASK